MSERLGKVGPLLFLFALIPFLPNVNSYFLADDFILPGWTRERSLASVAGFFDPNTFWFYRPLVKTYYWLGQSVFGLHALPFHIISILLHGLNGYLLYRLVCLLGAGRATGLVAALVFLLIPYHAETVSWIAATGDLAGLACIIGGILLFHLAYKRWGDQAKPLGISTVFVAGSVGIFAAGLFTRETTVMLLPLLALYVIIINRTVTTNIAGSRKRQHSVWLLMAASAYISVVVGYLAVQWVGRNGDITGRGGLEMHALNLDSVVLGIMEYVHGLVPGGGLIAGLPLDTQRVFVWVEVMILGLIAGLLWRTRQHLAIFGLIWMVFTPLIFVFFSAPTDRYFYLPSVGYGIFVAALLTRLVQSAENYSARGASIAIKAAAIILICALLLSQASALLTRSSRWWIAGRASAGVFRDVKQAVQDPDDYGAFYFVDMPATLDGAPFLRDALQPAIQLFYSNETLTASATTCKQLIAQVEMPKYYHIFRFRGYGVERISTKQQCF